jgi:hypothetical protein
MWILFACSEPPPPVTAPETHSWKDEGGLVIEGLEEVERLWKAGNKDAARTLAERVYTERWEPRLEPAAAQLGGAIETAKMEYQFGLLCADLEGTAANNGAKVPERIKTLEDQTRKVADDVARAIPDAAGAPPPPKALEGSKPLVPDVKPAWDNGG